MLAIPNQLRQRGQSLRSTENMPSRDGLISAFGHLYDTIPIKPHSVVSTWRVRGGEIRSVTGTPRGSKEHHYESGGGGGGGYPERVFGLTDEGREFTEEYLTDQRERPESYEMRVQRLEDEVDELNTANECLKREVEQLREEKADRDELDQRVDKIREDLQGTYWDSILDEIDERTADQ